jgi:crotonobetainyl-CoA:carnitine CoA-transferase CaiB-like acyl-CoA transferase
MSFKKPFKGIKIVELAGVLAGPSAGAFFAELGAKVIKIENKKTNGDVTRSWKLPSEDASAKDSAYFWSVNIGKKSIFLDLTESKDKEICLRHIQTADVILVNFKKGDEKKFKLSYSDLKKTNPSLIFAAISGFGDNDKRTAFDLILQAESGFMAMNGEPGSSPQKMPVALIDVLAGHHLKEAILIALLNRQKSGKGCRINVSLFDAALASLVNQGTNWLLANQEPKAMGSLHPNIAPYGELFTTKDKKQITLAVGTEAQFKILCELLNLNELINLKKFSTNIERVKHRKELFKLLQDKIEKFNHNALYSRCIEKGIPIGRIRKVSEALQDPTGSSMVQNNKIKTVKHFAAKFNN